MPVIMVVSILTLPVSVVLQVTLGLAASRESAEFLTVVDY